MKKTIFLLLLMSCLFASAQHVPKKRDKKATSTTFANSINTADLKKHLFIIAGKEMEGRETTTEGQRKAAAYIENHFHSIGLLPGNNGSYQMTFPVYQDSLLSTSIEINEKTYQLDQDFFLSLSQNTNSTYRFSEVVFVGNGTVDSLHDDYRGLDVQGKVVLMLGTPQTFSNSSRYPNPKLNTAQKNGAIAVLYISNNFPRESKTSDIGSMYLYAFKKSVQPNQYIVSEKMGEAIMGKDFGKAKKEKIPSRTYAANILLDFNKSTVKLQSSNVMGLLEGTDLKDQYVFITAHYDHLGIKDSVIWYGADDNGSGTVAVLEMAEAFVKAKAAGHGPRRSIVFMTVSGEENGLLGSEYYTDHPVYPFEKTTVNLNTDMIGRSDSTRKQGDLNNYVYVVGDDKLSTDLKPINEAVNNKYTKLELDYKFNDPKDRHRIYYRSDHYNFAQKGVPVIFYYDGMLGADYHKPTDTVDKINFELLAKRAQLVFYTAWEMANRNEMLKRDLILVRPRGF